MRWGKGTCDAQVRYQVGYMGVKGWDMWVRGFTCRSSGRYQVGYMGKGVGYVGKCGGYCRSRGM